LNGIRIITNEECEISYLGSGVSLANHSIIFYYKCLTHKINFNKEISSAEIDSASPSRNIPSVEWINLECKNIRSKRIE
jgi:hypothetical protein